MRLSIDISPPKIAPTRFQWNKPTSSQFRAPTIVSTRHVFNKPDINFSPFLIRCRFLRHKLIALTNRALTFPEVTSLARALHVVKMGLTPRVVGLGSDLSSSERLPYTVFVDLPLS